MADYNEIRIGDKLVYRFAIGSEPVVWNNFQDTFPLSPEVVNFVSASGITDEIQISAVRNLWNDMDASGVLDKMYVVYPFVGGTETAHSYNLLDTGSNTIGWTGTWVHDSNGATSDGSTAYADTVWAPNDVTGFTQSGSLGLYSLTTGSSGYDMGSEAQFGTVRRQTAVIIKYTPNDDFYPGTPIGAVQYSGSFDGSGMYMASVTTDTTKGSIDGSIVVSGSRGDYTLSGTDIVIGGFRSGGGTVIDHSARTYAFAFMGAGLTDDDHANIYSAVQTFQTTLSREV